MKTILHLESPEGRSLQEILHGMTFGQTLTVLDAEGKPVAILVSLRIEPVSADLVQDWRAQWAQLAQQVAQAWKSHQSALETLAEMRR